jgi:N-acetylglucosaminyldiphosphoundecaprenol N-acetyl-beta-D-mannosaminyltransferase
MLKMRPGQDILGVNIAIESFPSALAAIRAKLERPTRDAAYVCATSVHGVVEAQSDHELKHILNNAFLNLPDGLPLVKVARILGATGMEQVKGIELLPRVCEMTARMNVSHFFYGGNEGVAEDLAQRMRARFPGVKIAGFYCPPFRPLNAREKAHVAATINASGADIVWVGLSTPKQEKWIGEMRQSLNVKLLFSVGAAFDFETGRLKVTPPIFHKMGLEWFYRLILEPKRLWRRYLNIVPYFLAKSGLQLVRTFFVNQFGKGNSP